MDCDVSADGVPAGASGVILDIHNTSGSSLQADVRRKGSSDDHYAYGYLPGTFHKYAIVGLDSNRIFQVKIASASVKIWLVGYTSDTVIIFDNVVDKSVSATSTWIDVDTKPQVPQGATGIIVKLVNTADYPYKAGVRKKGGTDDDEANFRIPGINWICALCGVDSDRIFQGWSNGSPIKHYLVGYFGAFSGVVFKTNWVNKTPTTYGSWVDSDQTADTATDAESVIFRLRNADSAIRRAELRKNGSGDDRYATSYLDGGPGGHIWGIVALDVDRICEMIIENTNCAVYLMGYSGRTSQGLISDAASGIENVSEQSTIPITEAPGPASELIITSASMTLLDSGVPSELISTYQLWAIMESSVATDATFRPELQGILRLDMMDLAHVKNIQVQEPGALNETPVPELVLPRRVDVGHRGRVLSILGETCLAEVEALRSLFVDGEEHTLTLPTGICIRGLVESVEYERRAEDYADVEYVLRLLEMV